MFSAESLAPCPIPILWDRFSIPLPPLLLVLDYSSMFMFFSFAGGVGYGSVCPGAALDYFPQGMGRRVHDAHLFFLQFHASSLMTGSGIGSVAWHRKAFHREGV
jgi:hypothetical protein